MDGDSGAVMWACWFFCGLQRLTANILHHKMKHGIQLDYLNKAPAVNLYYFGPNFNFLDYKIKVVHFNPLHSFNFKDVITFYRVARGLNETIYVMCLTHAWPILSIKIY